jgi:putative ABC transport system permease protein
MVISVLERRAEIGLRRSLGATREHIRIQFPTKSLLAVSSRRRHRRYCSDWA